MQDAGNFGTRRGFLMGAAALMAGGCAVRESDLPVASLIQVSKSQRSLALLSGTQPLRLYRIELGFAPEGHKAEEGDGRTPEGLYFIDRKNPRSNFHLSLGISYPNRSDVAQAEARGVRPGGDIFIHGQRKRKIDKSQPDWTAGCIAVANREVEEIYAMVRLGTPIVISA